MERYHDIVVRFLMRDCADAEDAVRQMIRLLPRYPDESTTHIEQWAVESVCGSDFRECLSSANNEEALEALVSRAEERA